MRLSLFRRRPSRALLQTIRLTGMSARSLALLAWLLAGLQAHAAPPTPLLYEVSSPTNTVYLFGTIHVGAQSMYPVNETAQAAFERSQALALEADPTDQAAIMAAMSQALYTPPDNLARHVAADLYQRVESMAPGYGVPIDYARLLRPHLLAMVLAMSEVQRLGYDPALGMDMHFARLAKAAGKPIVQLESMAEQMAMFNAMPPEAQEGMLRATLDSLGAGKAAEELNELVAAWAQGDPDAILRAVQREFEGLDAQTANTLSQRIYDERNQAMAVKVEAILTGSTPHFVAVGAGHLAGPTGIPTLLEQKGYRVRRL